MKGIKTWCVVKDGYPIDVGESVVPYLSDPEWERSGVACPFCGDEMRAWQRDILCGRIVRVTNERVVVDGQARVAAFYEPPPTGTFPLGCKPCGKTWWTTDDGLRFYLESINR